MAKKGVATKIRLLSTGTTEAGVPTGYTYYTRKGRLATEKLEKSKYDPRAFSKETGKTGCHVKFVEKKMPPSKKH